jgi:hypothetical protein
MGILCIPLLVFVDKAINLEMVLDKLKKNQACAKMRLRVLVVLVLVSVSIAVASASSFVPAGGASSYEGQRVVRFDVRRSQDRAKIERWTAATGLDVWARHTEWIDVRLPLSVAAPQDVPMRVMSADLQLDIDAERADVLVTNFLIINLFLSLIFFAVVWSLHYFFFPNIKYF